MASRVSASTPLLSDIPELQGNQTISDEQFNRLSTRLREQKAPIYKLAKTREKTATYWQCICCPFGAFFAALCGNTACCPRENQYVRIVTNDDICSSIFWCWHSPKPIYLTESEQNEIIGINRQALAVEMKPFSDAIGGHAGIFNLTLEYLS